MMMGANMICLPKSPSKRSSTPRFKKIDKFSRIEKHNLQGDALKEATATTQCSNNDVSSSSKRKWNHKRCFSDDCVLFEQRHQQQQQQLREKNSSILVGESNWNQRPVVHNVKRRRIPEFRQQSQFAMIGWLRCLWILIAIYSIQTPSSLSSSQLFYSFASAQQYSVPSHHQSHQHPHQHHHNQHHEPSQQQQPQIDFIDANDSSIFSSSSSSISLPPSSSPPHPSLSQASNVVDSINTNLASSSHYGTTAAVSSTVTRSAATPTAFRDALSVVGPTSDSSSFQASLSLHRTMPSDVMRRGRKRNSSFSHANNYRRSRFQKMMKKKTSLDLTTSRRLLEKQSLQFDSSTFDTFSSVPISSLSSVQHLSSADKLENRYSKHRKEDEDNVQLKNSVEQQQRSSHNKQQISKMSTVSANEKNSIDSLNNSMGRIIKSQHRPAQSRTSPPASGENDKTQHQQHHRLKRENHSVLSRDASSFVSKSSLHKNTEYLESMLNATDQMHFSFDTQATQNSRSQSKLSSVMDSLLVSQDTSEEYSDEDILEAADVADSSLVSVAEPTMPLAFEGLDLNSLVSSIEFDPIHSLGASPSSSSSSSSVSSLSSDSHLSNSPSTATSATKVPEANDELLLRDLYKYRSTSPSDIYTDPSSSSSASAQSVSFSLSSPKTRRLRYVEGLNMTWPVKKVAEVPGNITLGGLMMVHEREDKKICGPIMPQGGIQALEAMLHTIDYVNSRTDILPGITLGAYILDDCDKDTYGLEQSIDFIKGSITNIDDTYSCTADGVHGGGGSGNVGSGGGGGGVSGSGITSSSSRGVVKRTWGVLGAASSATSIQVANLLRLFRIPQVSFFSTSSELSNKQRFEYFLRTVPSDKSQAQAIVEIVKSLGWSYVSIIYEESIYGIRAFNDLEELLDQNDICIAVKERLTKDSGIAGDSSYDAIVKKLATKPNSKGVIVFGSDQEVALLMRAVKRNNATGQFYWIGSDGWSARSLVFAGNEHQVEGTISVQPMANPVPGFDEYFLALTPHNNRRNPWFIEYWEQYFQCKWPDSEYTPYNLHFLRNCTGEERMTMQNGYEVEGQLQFVSDAVLAFAYAIQDIQRQLCPGQQGICARMASADGSELLQHLKTAQFKGIDGHEFYFAENGDGPARYRIIHYKQVEENKFDWVQIGQYVDGNLEMDLNRVQFRLHHSGPQASPTINDFDDDDVESVNGHSTTYSSFAETELPVSVCSQPCERGQVKAYLEGEKCCFHCISCTKYQVLLSETQCADCPSGYLPNSEQTECIPIPEEYMRPDSSWSVGAQVFAGIGNALTIFVIVIFVKHQDTPVVRASGRELSYVLLAGLLMCYTMTFALVQKPTMLFCGIQKAGIGLCFTIVYSALLTKTSMIRRIFEAGKKSAKRPSFISPRSQLIICGVLTFVQCFIIVVWFAFSPPRVMHFHPTRDDNKLICAASINAGYFVAFIYPIALIVVCTVYAVLTRNIPEAFNESKFIGFTMYTTCIIWLAFVPIYFTSSQSNHIALNITTLSVSISLSATVTLLCLFAPKLFIILLHPEKNVRQSVMMPQNKQNKYKPTITAAAMSTTTGAAAPLASVKLTELSCGVSAASTGVEVTPSCNTTIGGRTPTSPNISSLPGPLNDNGSSTGCRVDSATQSDDFEMADVQAEAEASAALGSAHSTNKSNGVGHNNNRRETSQELHHQRNGSLKLLAANKSGESCSSVKSNNVNGNGALTNGKVPALSSGIRCRHCHSILAPLNGALNNGDVGGRRHSSTGNMLPDVLGACNGNATSPLTTSVPKRSSNLSSCLERTLSGGAPNNPLLPSHDTTSNNGSSRGAISISVGSSLERIPAHVSSSTQKS